MTSPAAPRPVRSGAAPRPGPLHVDTWGAGTPVVLVHGSLATAAEEWEAQRPLVAEGFRFLAPDRRGYGRSPAAAGEDHRADAEDVLALLDDGPAHLVGHSYGGLAVLAAAARRPEAVRSLAVLEPPVLALGRHDPAGRALAEGLRACWDRPTPDDEWVVDFLEAVGSDPADFPPEFLAAARPLVPLLRHGRMPWDEVPPAELAAAPFPKLVVSGGHHPGLDAVCDGLAAHIGAERAVVAGAGHEIQFAAPAINDTLLSLWRRTGDRAARPGRPRAPQLAATLSSAGLGRSIS